MKRGSGILAHVSSLWGEYSIGTLSSAAIEFIDWLEASGFSYWQMLPLSPTDKYGSPYKSLATNLINPYFLSPHELYCDGLLTSSELDSVRQYTPYTVEFERLHRERASFVSLAASRASVEEKEAVRAFGRDNPEIYEAVLHLAKINSDSGISEDSRLYAELFAQRRLRLAWQKIRSYAASRGVKIIGDMPFYPDLNSYDVSSDRKSFLLDEAGLPKQIAGTPPDYFSVRGQIWGNPVYNWDYLKMNNYVLWQKRVATALSLYDIVRIDHFRALETYWSIPADAKGAESGEWHKAGGRAVIDAILEVADSGRIIAEDLGSIDKCVRELREYSGIPGMRVLQFGFDHSDSEHLPHNYDKNTVAYTGTHDNDTLLGFLFSLTSDKRRKIFDYFGIVDGKIEPSVKEIIRCMLASVADTVIIPIQDILGFGSDTRMNNPGTVENNWKFRITEKQLAAVDTEWYRKQNTIYSR